MRSMSTTPPRSTSLWRQYWRLTKPRVTQLAVFCAVIGMFLATPTPPPWQIVLPATLGIWLLASAAFAVNCLIESNIDARMQRTQGRATARGDVPTTHVIAFASLCGGLGMWILYQFVNPLTMGLTLATFVGYALIYTVLLKPRTPQNIVIGGLSGAMPPALGWAAVAGQVAAEAWVLVLIIFMWTPPHFWALALYKADDFRESGLPMLPLTHGPELTRLHIFLYSIALWVTTLLPFAIHMSGWLYFSVALVLGAWFSYYTWRLWKHYSDHLARQIFRFSILYLALLFAALLFDHYLS